MTKANKSRPNRQEQDSNLVLSAHKFTPGPLPRGCECTLLTASRLLGDSIAVRTSAVDPDSTMSGKASSSTTCSTAQHNHQRHHTQSQHIDKCAMSCSVPHLATFQPGVPASSAAQGGNCPWNAQAHNTEPRQLHNLYSCKPANPRLLSRCGGVNTPAAVPRLWDVSGCRRPHQIPPRSAVLLLCHAAHAGTLQPPGRQSCQAAPCHCRPLPQRRRWRPVRRR